MGNKRNPVWRIFGFVAGIVLSGLLAGGCLALLTGSESLFSFEGFQGNPLSVSFIIGFALSAGLAVYGLLGWIQARSLHLKQEAGFREIKELIDQEGESFAALIHLWEQKEAAWMEDKKKWNREKDSWSQQYEKWEAERENLIQELGQKRRELKAWEKEGSIWKEEKEKFDALREDWERSCRDRKLSSELEAKVKEYEKRIEGLERSLQKASKSGISSLSNVSRMLQNAIGRIAALSREPGSEPVKTFDEIHSLTQTFMWQFDNLLQFAQLDSGEFQLVVSEVNLEKLLSRIAFDFEPVADRKGISLVYEQEGGDIGRLQADERLMQRCLRTLMDNAVKFTEKGGRITLHGCLAGEKGKRRAEFEVKDTGIGIAPADQEKVFEPFVHDVQSRTEIREEGAGIGLSLLRAAVRTHGGDVEIESNAGEGTAFTIVFHERVSEFNKSQETEPVPA